MSTLRMLSTMNSTRCRLTPQVQWFTSMAGEVDETASSNRSGALFYWRSYRDVSSRRICGPAAATGGAALFRGSIDQANWREVQGARGMPRDRHDRNLGSR